MISNNWPVLNRLSKRFGPMSYLTVLINSEAFAKFDMTIADNRYRRLSQDEGRQMCSVSQVYIRTGELPSDTI